MACAGIISNWGSLTGAQLKNDLKPSSQNTGDSVQFTTGYTAYMTCFGDCAFKTCASVCPQIGGIASTACQACATSCETTCQDKHIGADGLAKMKACSTCVTHANTTSKKELTLKCMEPWLPSVLTGPVGLIVACLSLVLLIVLIRCLRPSHPSDGPSSSLDPPDPTLPPPPSQTTAQAQTTQPNGPIR